jgi:predicted dehydrogenase
MAIRLGIIGMGYCGRQQLKAAGSVPELEVTAIADAAPIRDLALNESTRVYEDWRKLVADPRVDAVSLCLPHHLHSDAALESLRAGKHLLMEKPLAGSLEEAQRIAAAARASSKTTMVEMTHRFFPPLIEGKALIQSGRLGEIFAVREHVIERVVPERCPAWMFDRKRAGGGVALTDGIHSLDRIAFVCGQALTFHHGIAGYSQRLGDVEDTAQMALTLSNGAPVNILLSFQRAGAAELDDELAFYGTHGTLRIHAWNGWRFEAKGGSAEEHLSYRLDQDIYARIRIGMAGALSEFARAIKEERRANPDPSQLIASQEILERYYALVRGKGAA